MRVVGYVFYDFATNQTTNTSPSKWIWTRTRMRATLLSYLLQRSTQLLLVFECLQAMAKVLCITNQQKATATAVQATKTAQKIITIIKTSKLLNISPWVSVCVLKVGEREKGKWLLILCEWESVCVNELTSFYSCTIWRFQVYICVHRPGCVYVWMYINVMMAVILLNWSTMIDTNTHSLSHSTLDLFSRAFCRVFFFIFSLLFVCMCGFLLGC